MRFYIKNWYKIESDDSTYSNIKGVDNLNNLSKINLFVGPNNSGKSRLIRNLFYKNKDFLNINNIELDQINKLIDELVNDIITLLKQNGYTRIGDINTNFTINHIDYIHSHENVFDDIKQILSTLSTYNRSEASLNYAQLTTSQMNSYINQIGKIYTDKFSSLLSDVPNMFDFQKIYIPTLRGLRPFDNNENHYLGRTIKDYFPKIGDNRSTHFIFTGLEMFEETKNHLLGNLVERERIKEYEIFLSKEFFNHEPIVLIPKEKDSCLHIKIGNEKEQPIYHLGDGIQQLIIITFPIFLHKDKLTLAFIEEPELYLHPSLQRRLLELFTGDYFDNTQVFFTTHSNHFLDITLDLDEISVFRVSKQLPDSEEKELTPTFIIENTSNDDLRLLDELGVRNSSVFLANCTIWVEGITDRMYLRHYLDIYIKQNHPKIDLKEDSHYAFIEYSGGNITHWSFLDEEDGINASRISNRIFLIADKDKNKEERHKILKKNLSKNFCRLDCLEIENLIAKDVLLKVVIDYESDDSNFNQNIDWSKLKDEHLGSFIEEKVLISKTKSKRRSKNPYKAASGTIKDKKQFCEKVIKHTASIDDLSPESKKLCKKMYEFIMNNNPQM